jgi:hypothetical protein
VRGQRVAGDLAISWIRRTRIGGDSWTVSEVPLAETDERYEVDILDGTTIKRTIASTVPSATYTSAQQTLDFGAPQAAVSVRVRQVGSNGRAGSARSAIV